MLQEGSSVGSAATQPFCFKTVKDLYNAPEEDVKFCVNGLLPNSGLSVLAGKPKAGKTTLARQLAVAVSQGTDFLGRSVCQAGKVLYLALEEKQSEVAAHFQLLGLTAMDEILVHCGAVPKDVAVRALGTMLGTIKDVKLVIIDPIFRFVGVSDSNDYVQVTNALECLLELARKHGAHILTVHHLKKRQSEDVMDGTLGSTAIVGGVDTFLALNVLPDRRRTLCTRQRYGKDMPLTELNWNGEDQEFSIGMTREESDERAANATRTRIEREMLEYILNSSGCTQESILKTVCGKSTIKKRVLSDLAGSTSVIVSGAGVKGDPFTYSIRPVACEEQ